MDVGKRLNLILTAVFVALVVLGGLLSFHRQRLLVRAVVRNNARILCGEIIQQMGQEPLHRGGYHDPARLQALVNRITMREKYQVGILSSAPINEAFAPSATEKRQLQALLAGNTPESDAVATEQDGVTYFFYLRKLVAAEGCLQCHGAAAAAPAELQRQFPPDSRLYGRRSGEVMGGVAVKVPMDDILEDVWSNIRHDFFKGAFAFFLVVTGAGAAIRRYVLGPLTGARRRGSPLGVSGDVRDEIGGNLDALHNLVGQIAYSVERCKESEERYRAVVEISRIPIITFTGDGKIVLSNPSAEKMLQYRREDLAGMDFFQFLENPEAIRSWFREQIRQQRIGYNHVIRQKIRRRDSTLVETDIGVTVLEAAKGLYLARIWEIARELDQFGHPLD